MKKKGIKRVAILAATGCLLLALSVTSFAATGSGYVSYRDAIKATAFTKNATMSAQFEVKDNGKVIFAGTGTQKRDNENNSFKTSITVAGVTKAYEASLVGGNLIAKVDDKYYKASKDAEKSGKDQRENLSASSSTVKLAEMLTDTLVGDVKNQFVSDGQTISVKLSGAQIPELARLALSAAAENSNRMGDFKNNDKQDKGMKLVMDKMPKLSNMDVKSIEMTATVDGKTLKDNQFTVTLTGQDLKGVSHELTVMLNAKITDVGNTKVDTINTTGKVVNAIDKAEQYLNR